LLGQFSGNPDFEKARAEFERAQKIKEAFHKDFDGVDFPIYSRTTRFACSSVRSPWPIFFARYTPNSAHDAIVPRGSITTWTEICGELRPPETADGRAFAGWWNNLTFCLWGRGVELLIDSVTIALTGQIKIYANLLADIGVRYLAAFAVIAPVT
jgi:hypothetical protein